MAQWLARRLATRVVQGVQIPAIEKIINSEVQGIINLNLNGDMVYSIHAQHLVQIEHTHP